MFSKEYEKKQARVNAYIMPNCLKGLRKIADENCNWSIYHNVKYDFFVAIAKPDSGAVDCVYGDTSYIYRQILNGTIPKKSLTKYARRLLRKKGYKRGF